MQAEVDPACGGAASDELESGQNRASGVMSESLRFSDAEDEMLTQLLLKKRKMAMDSSTSGGSTVGSKSECGSEVDSALLQSDSEDEGVKAAKRRIPAKTTSSAPNLLKQATAFQCLMCLCSSLDHLVRIHWPDQVSTSQGQSRTILSTNDQ